MALASEKYCLALSDVFNVELCVTIGGYGGSWFASLKLEITTVVSASGFISLAQFA